ncbi:MAG: transcription antitermination factor NusB [Treponema sp.]|nr:transcription antitermination factor NusB [Spirochaetia bacterium]MDD7014180.1 transcription antitermination factor NusB [Spirochaetales bacterium]MDY4902524.1 transcription antitermination factor NusB [Treponema sp.]
MSRRKGRILAFQALYTYDLVKMPLDELLTLDWDKDLPEAVASVESSQEESVNENKEDSYDFARLLISGTINHIEEIDSRIKEKLSAKWTMDRLNKVSLAILRISVFTLLFQKDVSPAIVIDEAISISKEYGVDDSYKFINAILDKISKETAS